MTRRIHRISYIFLCALPFLDLVLLGLRPLRVPGVHQTIGGVLFATIAVAAWFLGASAIGSSAAALRKLALAGVLLIVPMSLRVQSSCCS